MATRGRVSFYTHREFLLPGVFVPSLRQIGAGRDVLNPEGAVCRANRVVTHHMPVFVIVLLLVNVSNLFGPPMGDGKVGLGLSALVAYFLFAGVTFWLDRKRV